MKNAELHQWKRKVSDLNLTKKEKCEDLKKNRIAYRQLKDLKKKKCVKLSSFMSSASEKNLQHKDPDSYYKYLVEKGKQSSDRLLRHKIRKEKERKARCDEKKASKSVKPVKKPDNKPVKPVKKPDNKVTKVTKKPGNKVTTVTTVTKVTKVTKPCKVTKPTKKPGNKVTKVTKVKTPCVKVVKGCQKGSTNKLTIHVSTKLMKTLDVKCGDKLFIKK